MRIEPVGASPLAWDITPLLPRTNPQPKSLVDLLPMLPKPGDVNDIFSILTTKMKMEWILIQFKGIGVEEESEENYERYLQYPNSTIQALALSIVNPHDTNDEKMYKIEQWVQENITYQSDEKTYGLGEYWALPTLTMHKGVGDCEDGAFLMHSIALHAGIPADQLRTYGGLVWADNWGFTTGGHAWTSYKRETDDEWVIVDWCYWPTDSPLNERTPMPNRREYIDDWFYVDRDKTVESPYANYVRNPIGMYAQQEKGLLINKVV